MLTAFEAGLHGSTRPKPASTIGEQGQLSSVYPKAARYMERILCQNTSPCIARVLSIVAANPLSTEFLNAVNVLHPEIAYTYDSIIKRPIDLRTITHRALKGSYSGTAGNRRFRRNIRRIFLNAEAFNEFNPLITNLAGHLRWHTEGLWKAAAPYDCVVEEETGNDVDNLWRETLLEVVMSKQVVEEMIKLLDELIQLSGSKGMKYFLPQKLLLADSIKKETPLERTVLPVASQPVVQMKSEDGSVVPSLMNTSMSSDSPDSSSATTVNNQHKTCEDNYATDFKFMEVVSSIEKQLLVLQEEEDLQEGNRDLSAASTSATSPTCSAGASGDSSFQCAEQLSQLFSGRIEELGMMLAEVVTRGSNRSSIWAAAEGIYWASPPGGRGNTQWPALVIAGGGKLNRVISAINITRIPEHIRKVLRNKPKDQTLVEFLGTHEFGWVRTSTLKPYSPNDQSSQSKTKSKKTQESFQAAIDEANMAIEEGFGLARTKDSIMANTVEDQKELKKWFTSIAKSYFTPNQLECNPDEVIELKKLPKEENFDQMSDVSSEESSSSEEEEDYVSSSSDEEESEAKCVQGGILTEDNFPQHAASLPMRFVEKFTRASDWLKGGDCSACTTGELDLRNQIYHRKAEFPSELDSMLNDVDHSGGGFHFKPVIGWSSDGLCIVVRDVQVFESQYIPQYFKHLKKFSMFKFQLEAFQFRQVTVPNESREAMCFKHDCFHKNNPNRILDLWASISEFTKLIINSHSASMTSTSSSSSFLSFDTEALTPASNSTASSNAKGSSKKGSGGSESGSKSKRGGNGKKGGAASSRQTAKGKETKSKLPLTAAALRARRTKALIRVETYLQEIRDKKGLGPLGTIAKLLSPTGKQTKVSRSLDSSSMPPPKSRQVKRDQWTKEWSSSISYWDIESSENVAALDLFMTSHASQVRKDLLRAWISRVDQENEALQLKVNDLVTSPSKRSATNDAQGTESKKIKSEPSQKSSYRGVFYLKKEMKWATRIRVKNVTVQVGIFDSEKEAAKAYDDAVTERGIRGKKNFTPSGESPRPGNVTAVDSAANSENDDSSMVDSRANSDNDDDDDGDDLDEDDDGKGGEEGENEDNHQEDGEVSMSAQDDDEDDEEEEEDDEAEDDDGDGTEEEDINNGPLDMNNEMRDM